MRTAEQPVSTINDQITALNSQPSESVAPYLQPVQPQAVQPHAANNQPKPPVEQGLTPNTPQNTTLSSPGIVSTNPPLTKPADNGFLDGWVKKREELRAQESHKVADDSARAVRPQPIIAQTEPKVSQEVASQQPINSSGRFDVNKNDESEEIVFKIR